MKKVFWAVIVALSGASAINATTWRINPSPYAKANFKTVAEAMNSINVLSGDTLLLDGGLHESINISARKNMTIIGTGYFLDKNTDWTETQSSIISSVSLSEGSKIEGCDVTGTISGRNNCTISRCKASDISSGEQSLVERCIIANTLSLDKQAIAKNNIIINQYQYSSAINGSDGVIIENNVVYTTVGHFNYGDCVIKNVYNSYIRNNIIINAKQGFDNDMKPYSTHIWYKCSNNVVQNNVFSTPAQYADPTMPNNYYVGATVENTFVNEGSDDAKWQLLPNSAAKGAATHGGDCGAFSGATPYVLSGIPMLLPHITEALVPAKPTDGKITVKLKIENQNE